MLTSSWPPNSIDPSTTIVEALRFKLEVAASATEPCTCNVELLRMMVVSPAATSEEPTKTVPFSELSREPLIRLRFPVTA
jgi:hypothetical protein